MIYCPNCGAANEPAGAFCSNCCAPLPTFRPQAPGSGGRSPKRPRRSRAPLWIALGILGTALAVLAVILLPGLLSGGDTPSRVSPAPSSPEGPQRVYQTALANPAVLSCEKNEYDVHMAVAEGLDYDCCPLVESRDAGGGALAITTLQLYRAENRQSARKNGWRLESDAPGPVALTEEQQAELNRALTAFHQEWSLWSFDESHRSEARLVHYAIRHLLHNAPERAGHLGNESYYSLEDVNAVLQARFGVELTPTHYQFFIIDPPASEPQAEAVYDAGDLYFIPDPIIPEYPTVTLVDSLVRKEDGSLSLVFTEYLYDEQKLARTGMRAEDLCLLSNAEVVFLLNFGLLEKWRSGSLDAVLREGTGEHPEDYTITRYGLDWSYLPSPDPYLQSEELSSDPSDPAAVYLRYLKEHPQIQTVLYPYASSFIPCCYALVDLSGDGVPELLLGTDQDSYFSAEMTGVLICTLENGQVQPVSYVDTDTVYSIPELLHGRWLVTRGHGTGGYCDTRYLTFTIYGIETQREVYPGIGEGETAYYLHGGLVEQEVFEQYLLSVAGNPDPSLRQIEFILISNKK